MKRPDDRVLTRFHRALVDEIRRDSPEYLDGAFTVAEIYQSLVPYRTHRDRIGVEINGDYEDALMRLLAGDGEYLELESQPAKEQLRRELNTANPNTGLYREFAAVGVRLNPDKVPAEGAGVPSPAESGVHNEHGSDELSLLRDDGTGEEAPPTSPSSPPPPSAEALPATPEALPASPEASPATPTQEAPMRETPAERPAPRAPSSCPECDESLPERDSLHFCPHCGTNLLLTACGECGEVLERGWRYCVACGTPTGG